MPRGPKGEKRPADAIGNAVMIAKIATGEIEDITTEDGKNAAAVALGRMGGKARAEGMTAKRRKEIAKKAAKSRWATGKKSGYPLAILFNCSVIELIAAAIACWDVSLVGKETPLCSRSLIVQPPHPP